MWGMSVSADGSAVIDRGPVTLEEPEHRHPLAATTLGTAVTVMDEQEIDGAMYEAGLWTRPFLDTLTPRHHRDWAIAEASGRWSRDLEPRQREFVPGDVCGLRAAACQGSLVTAQRIQREATTPLNAQDWHRVEREMLFGAWLYDAAPYFLPVTSAIGIAGSHAPDASLLDELRLPFQRVAVYFGADLTIPARLLGADHQLAEVIRKSDEVYRSGRTTYRADEYPPYAIHSSQLALVRGQELQLSGVVFHADDAGCLADVVLWLTVASVPSQDHRRLTPGLLSRSTLRPLALNLVAAAAWGDWHPPDDIELADDPDSPAFLRQIRRGAFRRREPGGAAAGVRVLDVRRMTVRAASGSGSHASPVTHLRRGHWRRQRVGPREDWRYERRFIPPVVVNPGQSNDSVTIYRLPEPPT